MVTKILNLKSLSGNPADGIDNLILSVFGRLFDQEINFFVKAPAYFKEKGAVKKLVVPKIMFLITNKPDYLWGIGNIKELFFLFFKPRRTKYVINFHTILLKDNKLWRVRTPWLLRRLLFLKADKIICPSEFSAKSVKKYFPDKNVIRILNGVDLDLFHPGKKNEGFLFDKYQIDFSRPLIAFVGTLQPRKRPDLFIEIARNYPLANFVAVGREFLPVDFLASTKGLKNFQWIEKMSREDIAVLFASSKIFVFPSLNEPAAAVILEAMASGCVPILSNSGGNSEFLKDGESGFLVDVNNKEKENFLTKIDLLLNDVILRQRLSKNARKEAERHSIDNMAQEYLHSLL